MNLGDEMKKTKPFVIASLCGYVILYLVNLFSNVGTSNDVTSNAMAFISFMLCIAPLYYMLSEEKPHAKLIFLFAEIIKLLRLVFRFHFTFLSILYLFTQLLFCLFLYFSFYRKENRFVSKLCYFLVFLFMIEIICKSVSYITSSMILTMCTMVFYYIYKVLFVFYLKDK